MGILSQIFDLALDDEIILKNPTKNIKLPKHQKKRIKPFSKDEVLKIIDFSKKYNDKFQIFLKLGFFTGMRTGEILALKINDIDFKAKTININSTRSRFGESTPKTFYSIRKIPLFNVIYSDLYEYVHKYKNNTYLLETQYSDPYKDDYVFSRNYWKIILKDLNLEYRRLYSMRHTFATNALLSKSLSPIELSKILGHSNCEMVYKVYVSYINNLEKNIDFDINIY
ncbi:site-specific integrase [Campylobacter lari]|uniref:site-specific integrase n=1 Tax=Campylobacter lari TaxID=201 RepID=UPI0021F7C55B|nr:site-specific integrase [Campylobacter lari]MCW0185584.1 site-specific integrase [Campylobacter lari]